MICPSCRTSYEGDRCPVCLAKGAAVTDTTKPCDDVLIGKLQRLAARISRDLLGRDSADTVPIHESIARIRTLEAQLAEAKGEVVRWEDSAEKGWDVAKAQSELADELKVELAALKADLGRAVEACAKVCEEGRDAADYSKDDRSIQSYMEGWNAACSQRAAMIRNRSSETRTP